MIINDIAFDETGLVSLRRERQNYRAEWETSRSFPISHRENSERFLLFLIVAEGRGSMLMIGSSAILAAFGFSLISAGTDSDHGISESR